MGESSEFEDFDGAFGPVVLPADDEVAAGGVVAVPAEVGRAELELDADPLPGFGGTGDADEGVAVGVAGGHADDDQAGFLPEDPGRGFVRRLCVLR